MAKLFTALDIGTSKIRGLVVEERKDGLLEVISVFETSSDGFRRGILVDVEEATYVFRNLVSDLKNISKKACESVILNFNNPQIKTVESKAFTAVTRADQEIQRDDIDKVIELAQAVKLPSNYMVLHHIIREYIVDEVGDIQEEPLGMIGNRLGVNSLIVEAFSPHYQSLMRSLRRVGLNIEETVFSPLAAAEAVLSKKQKDLGVMLIDFGYSLTSFVIFEEGRILEMKTLPLGSNHLTNDLAVGLKIPIDLAENLKIRFGYALSKEINRKEMIKLDEEEGGLNKESDFLNIEFSKRFVSEIIEARLEEILNLINNELKGLKRTLNFQLPAGVVLVGGGAKLSGLVDLTKQNLKLSTYVGLPDLTRFEINNPIYKTMLNDPEFAVAVGLVLWKIPERSFKKRDNLVLKVLKRFLP